MNLILGGTHGLGYEIAQNLKARGQENYIIGRSYEIARDGDGLAVDLRSTEEVNKLVTLIDEGRIIVDNFYWVAGVGYIGDFAKQQKPEEMVDVNFAHIIPIAQAVWRHMLDRGAKSHFVVISSTTGEKPRKDEAVYAATKFAQVGFTRSLGLESERLGSDIKVALFLPGGMQTPFWDGAQPDVYDTFNDPVKVAAKIVEAIQNQKDYFYEETIDRGSV